MCLGLGCAADQKTHTYGVVCCEKTKEISVRGCPLKVPLLGRIFLRAQVNDLNQMIEFAVRQVP